MSARTTLRRILRTAVGVGAVLWDMGRIANALETSSDARLEHRFLRVEISPDGALVASVEGDSPVNGTYPALRDLVIRRVRTGAQTTIPLPCGRVPQCWP